jgi:hypothetical protein
VRWSTKFGFWPLTRHQQCFLRSTVLCRRVNSLTRVVVIHYITILIEADLRKRERRRRCADGEGWAGVIRIVSVRGWVLFWGQVSSLYRSTK